MGRPSIAPETLLRALLLQVLYTIRNDSHASTTDPEARLVGKKGQEARLVYQGHVLTENRNGLLQPGADPQPRGGDVSSRARPKPRQLRPGELAPGPLRPELTGPRPPSHPSRGETFSAAC
jgi:hypothetical protein